jgi:glycosyltransferase involved in cell wall biosynthesis
MPQPSTTTTAPSAAPSARRALELLGPSAGGIRTHVAELATRLAPHGWEALVAGPSGVMDGVGRLDAEVAVPASWSPLSLRRARRDLRTLLATTPVDVVHAHGLKAALVALGGRHRPPVVLTLHNLVDGTHGGWTARLLGPLEARIIRRVDHVIAISDDGVRRAAELRRADRCSRILPVSPVRRPDRPTAEVRAAYDIAPTAPMVVAVARLHPQKDLSTFVRAVARVRAGRPDVRAVIVGEGPEREAITAEIERAGLTGTVTLAGQRANPADEMAAADVVVMSSRWEAGPLVMVECLSLGRPFVSTAVGALTAMLVDGRDARVVAVGDDGALAAAIAGLLDDPAAAARMGEAGRHLVAPIVDGDALVAPVAEVYERLCPADRS